MMWVMCSPLAATRSMLSRGFPVHVSFQFEPRTNWPLLSTTSTQILSLLNKTNISVILTLWIPMFIS